MIVMSVYLYINLVCRNITLGHLFMKMHNKVSNIYCHVLVKTWLLNIPPLVDLFLQVLGQSQSLEGNNEANSKNANRLK